MKHAGLEYTETKEINVTELKDNVAYNFKWEGDSRGYDVALAEYIKERIDRISHVCIEDLSTPTS